MLEKDDQFIDAQGRPIIDQLWIKIMTNEIILQFGCSHVESVPSLISSHILVLGNILMIIIQLLV